MSKHTDRILEMIDAVLSETPARTTEDPDTIRRRLLKLHQQTLAERDQRRAAA